jgi:hypothetical protein
MIRRRSFGYSSCVSKIRYILTTKCVTDDLDMNKDIVLGDWRSLNLTLSPFNFPRESLCEIEDCVVPHPSMTLNLWAKEQGEAILPALQKIY